MAAQVGPDAWRLLHLGGGGQVVAPFYLRWLLPALCRNDMRRWWAVWLASWPVLAAGMVACGRAVGLGWWPAVAASALVVALPGVLGPVVTRPVGVDLPALALLVWAAAAWHHGWWPVALAIVAVATTIRETSPVWAALWLWHPLPAVCAVLVIVRHVTTDRRGVDPLTASQPVLMRVHEHPIRSAVEHRAGRGRDGWLLVAPWGACLAALWAPSWPLVVLLVVAYAQLFVATDAVRLVQCAAAPVVALAAVQVIPVGWLLPAVIVHAVWWRRPERV